jgi:hypothetical protein
LLVFANKTRFTKQTFSLLWSIFIVDTWPESGPLHFQNRFSCKQRQRQGERQRQRQRQRQTQRQLDCVGNEWIRKDLLRVIAPGAPTAVRYNLFLRNILSHGPKF